jgi:hypothetical protein
MEQTAFNPQNGGPETINIESTDESTNWFDGSEDSHGIFSITDLQTRILIKEAGHTYQLYVNDVFTSGYRS